MGKPPVFIYTQQKMRVRARRACFLLHRQNHSDVMSPIDGPILLVSEICFPHTSFDNIPKNQPSKAKGLEGVAERILTILIHNYICHWEV